MTPPPEKKNDQNDQIIFDEKSTRIKEEQSMQEESEGKALYFANGDAYTLGINKTYQVLTGITQNQVYGKNLAELENRFFRPSVTLKVLEEKRPISLIQHILTSNKKVIVTGNPLFDENGKIVMVVTTVEPYGERQVGKNLQSYEFGDVVIKSDLMKQVLNRAILAAGTDMNVLISGESGTGKEILTQIIHEMSPRKDKPLVPVNAASLPENLIESELFGYVKGAFTGAAGQGSQGLVRAAHGGTLFLDEISELPLPAQAKLLRLLDNKEVTPLGSNHPFRVDVRIIAATNQDLAEKTVSGGFRRDLYYRINTINITIPPLRKRREDIEALADYFINEINAQYNINKTIHPSAVQLLKEYPWPGNIRELKNIIERLGILYSGAIVTPEMVLQELESLSHLEPQGSSFQPIEHYNESLDSCLANVEKELIRRTMERTGQVETAAGELGVHRTTLTRKMKKYGLGYLLQK